MALVCDIKSEESKGEIEEENADLEDGEIEDDEGDEEMPVEAPIPVQAEPIKPETPKTEQQAKADIKFRDEVKEIRTKKHEKKHLTEAEKSVMRLHKLERMEREKREKYRRDQGLIPVAHPIDAEEDFATSLEKAIAKVLKKDKPPSEDEKVEEQPPEKRGKKRKKKDKHKKSKKNKQQQQELPQIDQFDDFEMMNMRSGSPDRMERTPPPTKSEEESFDTDYSSDHSHEGRKSKKHKKNFERNRKFREQAGEGGKNKRGKNAKRNTGVCLFYLQGLCQEDDCKYSHEVVQPIKLELCKFYMLECCAKGDKCLYMHQDFPCKYYHTGIPCPSNEKCKFAHGGPLSDGLKQILYKHIETAPKEILGNFPRLSRENANVMIQQAQKNLEDKYCIYKRDDNNGSSLNKCDLSSLIDTGSGGPQEGHNSDASDGGKKENKRNRPSRWQDLDPMDKDKKNLQLPPAFAGLNNTFNDQDMRINRDVSSNGDVDMRTLSLGQSTIHPTNIVNPNILQKPPPIINSAMLPSNLMLPNLLMQPGGPPPPLQNVLLNTNVPPPKPFGSMHLSDVNMVDIEKYKKEAGLSTSRDVEVTKQDSDIRSFSNRDSDIRQFNKCIMSPDDDERLQIVMEEDEQKTEEVKKPDDPILNTLPKTQRDLFRRIQLQQKDTVFEEAKASSDNEDANIDWYSDDEDDNKLTIKDDFEDKEEKEIEHEHEEVKPQEVVEKLGDLSKIDISSEVTKLLSAISKQTTASMTIKDEEKKEEVIKVESRRDPRGDPRSSGELRDPRKARVSSTEEKMTSIYEQGSIGDVNQDVDLRAEHDADADYRPGGRPDVDLRQMGLPFKGMQNYTPASEIDASFASHPPITWKVYIVEIPKPDYTGLKLSSSDAQSKGDPRLRKIFRLSIDEKDSPMSPKESPSPKVAASSAPTRVDPRRKKLEVEKPQADAAMTYTQQLSMLQGSPFYQSLTSNQKVMLNQELATRNDQSGLSDPIISAMLQNLGLVPPQMGGNLHGQSQQASNILANVNNLGFQPPMLPQNMGQGLLGAAPPGLQNLPPDFNRNFDPRNGILGNGPPPFANFPPENNNFGGGGGFNDDFFPDQGSFNNNSNNNNRDNNRGFRDRPRRGRPNNNRNNRNFFRRHNNNRNNRNNSPS